MFRVLHGILRADSRNQLRVSLALLVIILLTGTLGFLVLGDSRTLTEAVYLTVMIVTTVGLKEQYPRFNDAEGIWSLFIMLLGISGAFYAGGNLMAFLVGGELRKVLGRQQLIKKIKKLEDHFIVCGFGRMGRALCTALAARNITFVLIDINEGKASQADQCGYLYIHGDATLEETLTMARIDSARGLATCLKSDADNVLVSLSARGLNEHLPVTARAEKLETQSKLERAGATNVICPPVLGAHQILQMMLHPAVEELVELAVIDEDLQIAKVGSDELPAILGRSLRELMIPSRTGLMVVAALHSDGRRELNPAPDFRIREGDELIVIGPPEGTARLLEMGRKGAQDQ